MTTEDRVPFTAHLEELRKRLITCFIAVGVGFAASYGFKEKLFYILVAPLKRVMKSGDSLIYTHLPEAFFTFLKTALISGLTNTSPLAQAKTSLTISRIKSSSSPARSTILICGSISTLCSPGARA